MGGHDDHNYFKAPWTEDMWNAVQRAKGPSSLHMEALQLLVVARLKQKQWADSQVTFELGSLGLVRVVRNNRHQDPRINDILKELSQMQLDNNFSIHPQWAKRCKSGAADALSKNDMPRFSNNIQGGRTRLIPTANDLRSPHLGTAAMRRTAKARGQWGNRPCKAIAPAHPTSPTTQDLRRHLTTAVEGHSNMIKDPTATMSGVNHYLNFCRRTGTKEDVAPASLDAMAHRIHMWAADAPITYKWNGKTKKALATRSISTYMGHIDKWWARTTGQPREILAAATAPHRALVTANYASGQRQVHGATHKHLSALIQAADTLPTSTGRAAVGAAYSLAWYALLRPSEYMLTPAHKSFEPSRHMRAGDVVFYTTHNGIQKRCSKTDTPTHMTVNTKQSKTDWSRLGPR